MASTIPPSGPSRGSARRVPGSRVILVGLLFVAAVTAFVVVRIVQTSDPGPDPRSLPKRPGSEAAIGVIPTRPAPVLADSTLRGVVLEGGREVLEPGLLAWRISDEPKAWLVERSWFYIPVAPVRLRSYTEMQDLAESGAISDTTRVGMVSYRWKLHAATLEEALRVARREMPGSPPPAVLEAVAPRPPR